ncbi:MAG: symmetrical bis(5'-nucleosyl)-tetraphosphatase [Gammaproteobacteria bacterium]|nr:symmetrical bis(5'-nucleosyl)-tetraphosphatase [Gammaproteobacteria bacterium]
MSTYAIGDIQGCFDPLERLLALIEFDPDKDSLWFTGDLVNRGPKSLATLRFIKNLGERHHTVLGNHDLHLLAVAHGAHPGSDDDSIAEILAAPDRDELLNWLRQQPLLHHDATLGYTMAHAGIAPAWDLEKAQALAKEVENVLQSDEASQFFHHMYGNRPDFWQDDLQGWERLRCITNYFTRMRFCYEDGRLDLRNKGTIDSHAGNLVPWFRVKNRANADLDIIFGHWAALAGITHTPNTFALDTGCVWGYCLTAMRLEDQKRFQVLSSN